MSDMDVSRVLAQIRTMQGSLQAQASATQLNRSAPTSEASGFTNALRSAIDNVNATQQKAVNLQDRFSRGDRQVELADVMLASARSQVEFRAMAEVRNRLVNAYQDIMNMPI